MSSDVPAKFVELLTQNQIRLQSYIGSLLVNPESTWDVLQETNRVLIEKNKDYVDGTSFVNWSLTVAQFQVMAWLRNQKRDRHILTPELAEVFSRDTSFESWTNTDPRIIALEECLQTLEPAQRELVAARYRRGDTLQEISDRTQKSVNSLKQIFFRLRKSLSTCIEEKVVTQ